MNTPHTVPPFRVEVCRYPNASPPRKELTIVSEKLRLAIVECDFTGDNPFTVPEPEARANAALFAAAPELLAALEMALIQITQDNDNRGVDDSLRGTEWQVRGAIASAKRETSHSCANTGMAMCVAFPIRRSMHGSAKFLDRHGNPLCGNQEEWLVRFANMAAQHLKPETTNPPTPH